MKVTQEQEGQMRLHLQRQENGNWVPWELVVEMRTGRVLEGVRGAESAGKPVQGVVVNNAGIAARMTKLDDGRTVMVPDLANSDPLAVQALKFFLVDEPCFFLGCEELRKQWQADVAALPENCPACAESDLQRRYTNKIRDILAASHTSRPPAVP